MAQIRNVTGSDMLSGFSPLHEGDASVAPQPASHLPIEAPSFSPLHEGDASVAGRINGAQSRIHVSVPFTRGTPLWLARASEGSG